MGVAWRGRYGTGTRCDAKQSTAVEQRSRPCPKPMTIAVQIATQRSCVFPTGDDVHIWTVRHDDSRSHDEDARRVLSDEEIAQFSRFRNARQRVQRIHARAALRHILSSYLDTPPARIVIHTGIYGKPSVAGVEFNCSHAPSLTLVAVAAQPVGVDVEPVGHCADIDAIRHRFINEAEPGEVAAMSPRHASIELLRLWVIKEACLKAIGTGLTADPRELCVRPSSSAVFDVSRGADVLRARLLPIPGTHIAAVAARALDQVVVRDEAHTRS